MKLVSQLQAESDDGGRPPAMTNRVSAMFAGIGCLGMLLLGALVFLPFWVWVYWRIEPGPNEIAVLIRKTGNDLPPSEIIAPDNSYKGIQLEVLPPGGRYFYNPYTWDWKYKEVTDIPAGKVGVMVQLFGKDLPAGEILATPGAKGILPEVLNLGKHAINPYAYEVHTYNVKQIKPGCVGVVTSLIGKDMLTTTTLPENQRNTFLVPLGLKGVQSEVRDPGTYPINPFTQTIVEVNLQSQRFEMGGGDAIRFLTQDGFQVTVEGTIEFNIQRDKAALLTHQVGDLEDIINKIILPRARGFSRVEGSKKSGIDFIVGETRQQFQNGLEQHLKETCDPWGVSVNSVLIRNIIPPQDIAKVIRDRELAVQEAKKFDQQIEQAKSGAELVRQEMLAIQNSKKVEADTGRLKAEIGAKQNLSVQVTAAKRDLDVSRIGLQSAQQQAQAQLLAAQADRDVIRQTNKAEADVLKAKVDAFGSGDTYVRYLLYGKLAPRIQSILTADQPGNGAFGLPLPAAVPAPDAAPKAKGGF